MKTSTGLILAAALSAFACSNTTTSTGDELADSTPDVEGLTLEMTGAATEQSRAEGNDEQALTTLGSGPEFLADVRAEIKGVNTAVKALVAPIEALAATTGTMQGGNVKMYGPQDSGNGTYELFAKKAGVNVFWKLQAKTKGADDSTYAAVAVGRLHKGDLAHRGRGVIGMDLDKLGTIDSAFLGRGKLYASFTHVGMAKMLIYRLDGFTPDPATTPALTATFYGHKSLSGEARVRVGGFFDLVSGPNGNELMLARAHWIPEVGGRADVFLPATLKNGNANGDVPAGHFIVGHACWNQLEQEGFKVVLSCEAGKPASSTTCTVIETSGDRANCPAATRGDEDPPTSQDDDSTEAGAPGTFDDAAPSAMPDF